MRPLILPLVLACVVVGLALSGQSRLPRARAVFPDGTAVSLEVADTEPVRERGLMFREHLAPNEGMVFVFPEPGYYPFWMKNTLIPLDMLWLDSQARIVSIARSVPPCKADPCPSYPPEGTASYVIEVVAGFSRQHALKIGDVVKLESVPAKGR
jgi:uncharacterized membrane protein (UPF0127 family)